MARYFYVKLTTGTTSQGPYTIYYNTVNVSNIATVTSTGDLATGLTYTQLTSNDGVKVTTPDTTTLVILYSDNCFITVNYNPPTLSPTQSVTITPSITKTPTQTIQPTQSITPTITPSITPTNCTCNEYDVTNITSNSITIFWTRCNVIGGGLNSFTISSGTTYSLCACSGTIDTTNPLEITGVTITNQGTCAAGYVGTPTPTPTKSVTPSISITPTITSTPFYVNCNTQNYIPFTITTTGQSVNDILLQLSTSPSPPINGSIISILLDANQRPNKFEIRENGSKLYETQWLGFDSTWQYNAQSGYTYGSNGQLNFIYDNTATYTLRAYTSRITESNFSDTFTMSVYCSPPLSPTPSVSPTRTATPSMTPTKTVTPSISITPSITPDPNKIDCNQITQFSGGQNYPFERTIYLGPQTGTVTLTYDPKAEPDRFIVYFDNTVVIDTGYVGSGFYSYSGNGRNLFTVDLNGKYDAIYTGLTYPDSINIDVISDGITYPDTTDVDGYPKVYNQITPLSTTFQKNSATTTCKIQVFGPSPSTVWEFIMSCPQ